MTKFYYADLWGSRDDKYRYLQEHDITTVEWTEIEPKSPFYLFIPQNADCRAEYDAGWKITEIMPVNSVGLYTARDDLAIQWTKDELKEVLLDFSSLPPEVAREKYNLGEDSRDWQVTLAQQDVQLSQADSSKIQLISYRPFDTRFTYYTGKSRGFICMPRPDVMYHVLQGDNLGINVCRQIISESWSHILVSSLITDNCYVSNESRERNYLFSLYVYPDTANEQGSLFVERSSNLSPDFITAIREKLGYIPTPEAIFYYIYAIFHSPTYRQRYAEFLKIDFPRVPLTSNDQLFKDLGQKVRH
jgi:hypothetical protein